jgi:hypothetical protein
MGLILSTVYQKGDLLVSEISIKNYTKESLSFLEDAKNRWGIVHRHGDNLNMKTEGHVATLSAEFTLDEIDYANLFPVFISNVMEGDPINKNYDYDDEDSRDIE